MALQLLKFRGSGMVSTEPRLTAPDFDHLMTNLSSYLAQLAPIEQHNVYYTTGHHVGAKEGPGAIRTQATLEMQDLIAFDCDHIDGARIYEYRAAVAQFLQTDADHLTLVNSGNGAHIIAQLSSPILRSNAQFKVLKPAYNRLCDLLDQALQERGLPGKFDRVIWDAARVLRLPGSRNVKKGQPDKMSELLHYAPIRLSVDLPALSGLDEIERENCSPAEIRRCWPTPDFAEMVKECRFVAEAAKDPGSLKEPLVFDLFSLLSTQPQTAAAEVNGVQHSPFSLAEHVFKNATGSSSIKSAQFLQKWEQSGKYGVRRCTAIDDKWGKCKECPHFHKVPTPLALKSPEHVASEANGYWIMNKDGKLTQPAYDDLARKFEKESPFLIASEERTLVFDGKKYEVKEGIDLKAWIERTVKPSDPVRENHRKEFVSKLKARGRDVRKNELILKNNTKGRLPFQNGVLDLMTNELGPHSANYGFLYCLPYDYNPEAESEFFLDWLATMMIDRPNLMQTVLDVMSYCLWPKFEDHIITFLIGEGANGKSTFIEILRALLGEENCAGVSVDQLVSNRFMAARLEGKMVNLCAEASGGELTSKDLNILKSFSEDGTFTVERKGEQGYEMKNSAKLIFSLNQQPLVKEHTHAVKRRILAIPFDYRIEEMDSTIGERLTTTEIPGIASLLVANLRRNLMKNGGRFKVNREGQELEDAQFYMLSKGNSVVQWADECLIPDDGSDLIVQEAYDQYRAWSERVGMSPMNKFNFVISFKRLVLRDNGSSHTKKIEGKAMRVMGKYRMRKEGENDQITDL